MNVVVGMCAARRPGVCRPPTQVLLRPILANKHSALHWDAVAAQILLWNVIGIVVIVVWSAGCSIVVFWSLKSFGLLRVSCR